MFASIEGAEPVYDYEEFLIKDLRYDYLLAPEKQTEERDFLLTWKQGYNLSNYHYSFLDWESSSFSLSLQNYYWKKYHQGNLFLEYDKKHLISIHYYDWDHKVNLEFGDIVLTNNLRLYSENDMYLLWKSNLRYLFHQYDSSSSSAMPELTDFSFSGDIAFFASQWGLISTYNFPYQHQWEKNRSAVVYYRHWESFLLGSGLSIINNNSTNIYLFFTARFNLDNRLIIRFKLEEDFVSYPFHSYFLPRPFLWKSSLSVDEQHFEPYPVKKITLGTDFITKGILHKFAFEYRLSDELYDFYWFLDDEFSIYRFDERHEVLQLAYSASYKHTNINLSLVPTTEVDFEPLLVAGITQKAILDVFNEFTVGINYNYQERIKRRREFGIEEFTDSYLLTEICYRYTKWKSIILETGFSYSFLEAKNSFIGIKPEFYLQISYGKRGNESLY